MKRGPQQSRKVTKKENNIHSKITEGKREGKGQWNRNGSKKKVPDDSF